MTRKPRIYYPGAVYHVILRGNGGQDIPLAKIMQNISFRYTRYINKRKKRIGHLFQGRYKALLIDANSYLLELVRYIHLNPVRAGIVNKADKYPWSGHRAYLGTEEIPWLTTDLVLGQFSGREKSARQFYADFVSQDLGNNSRLDFHCGSHDGRILGDDSFAEKAVAKAMGKYDRRVTMTRIIEEVCRAYNLLPSDLAEPGRKRKVAEPRAMASLLVLEAEGLTLTDFASFLNRDLSGLSQAAGRLQKSMTRDHILAKKLHEIKKNIQQTPISQA